MAPTLPAIPGNGVGGTVDGRRVISSTGGAGAYAERVAVPRTAPIEVPPESRSPTRSPCSPTAARRWA